MQNTIDNTVVTLKPMASHSGVLPAMASVYMSTNNVQNSESIIYEANGNEQLVGMYVASRISNGVGVTDTYTVRINGVDTLCALSLVDTTGGSTIPDPVINLSSLNKLSIRVDTGNTLAEDVIVTLIINKK